MGAILTYGIKSEIVRAITILGGEGEWPQIRDRGAISWHVQMMLILVRRGSSYKRWDEIVYNVLGTE